MRHRHQAELAHVSVISNVSAARATRGVGAAHWIATLTAAAVMSMCASAAAQTSAWGVNVGYDESDSVYVYCNPGTIVSQSMSATGRAYIISYLHRVTSDGTTTHNIVTSAAINRARLQCYGNASFTGTPTLAVGADSSDSANDSSFAQCPANKPYGAYAECQLQLAGPYPQNAGEDGAFVYHGSACGIGIKSTSARMVGQETGNSSNGVISDQNGAAPSVFFNDTVASAGIYGTDLGSAFYSAGQLFFAFGDSKNSNGQDADATGHSRHSTLANASPFYGLRTFFGGVLFSGWFGATAAAPDAKQVIPSGTAAQGGSLPSAGFSISENGHNYKYLWFMQVAGWTPFVLGGPSSIAYSIDGQTWKRAETTAAWKTVGNTTSPSYFTNVAAYQEAIGSGAGYVYIFGTDASHAYQGDANGVLSSGVKLARVRARHASIIDKSQYTYWNGSAWTSDESAAAFVLPDSRVRDVTVAYNTYANRYMLMYLDGNGFASKLVLLTSRALTGPWTTSASYAIPFKLGMYSPILHDRMMTGQGKNVTYFASNALPGPYNVGAWYMDVVRSQIADCSQ